jgi:hypothetical protein
LTSNVQYVILNQEKSMNIIDIAKFVLLLGIAGSIVGISVQFMRLLSAVTENIKDLRKTVKNVGVITDELVVEQKLLRESIENISGITRKISELVTMTTTKIMKPLTAIASFFSTIAGVVSVFNKKFSKHS